MQEYKLNITQIGQAFGFSRDTVRKRLNAANVTSVDSVKGVPLYELSAVGPALFGYSSTQKKMNYDPDELDPKSRRDFFQSENERLKFEEKTRQLVPVDEVRHEIATILKATVSYFENLPDHMERTRLFSDNQLDALEKENDKLRNHLHEILMNVSD